MATVETGVAGGVSFALTGEQRELRALAREFAEKEIRPQRGRVRRAPDPCDRHHCQGARDRPDEPAPPRIARRARAAVLRRDARRRGAELGLLRDRHVDRRERPRGRPDPDRRHRGAEEAVARTARRGPDPRLLRAHRAGRRLGRVGDPDDRRAQGRRIRGQRFEDVHHERGPCGVDGLLRLDRPAQGPQGPLRLRDPDGRARRHDREAPRQDGTAGDRHLGRRLPGRRRSGRRTGSAARETASRSRCRPSTSPARARRSARSASPRLPSSSRSSTRRSASSSGCRSR